MLRKSVLFGGIILIAVVLLTVYSNEVISKAGKGKMFTNLEDLPAVKTGLLLGTGKYLQNGHLNPYYSNRIAAAADLLRAKK